MSSVLSSYFERFVAPGESNYYSHLSMMDQKKYRFEQNQLDEMWSTYCDALHSDPDMVSSILERSMDYTTLRGDFDMKIKKSDMEKLKLTNTNRFYEMEEVRAVIKMFFDVIQKTVKGVREEQLYCFLMEKEKPYEDGDNMKSGFHVEFPFILLSKADQNVIVFPKLVQSYEDLDIFTRFGDYQQHFFDTKVVNNAWLLYGSKKTKTSQSYRVTHIYNKNIKEVTLEHVMENRVVYNCNEEDMKLENEFSYHLPRILSISHHGKKKYISRAIPSDMNSQKSKFKKLNALEKLSIERAVPANPEERLKEVRELMPFLNDSRATDYLSWMKVGWILHTIGEGSQDALQIWIDFSRRTTSGNFSESVCIYEWGKMSVSDSEKNATIGTIRFWAKEDDPEGYGKYCKSKSRNVVLQSIDKNGTLTPYAAATALYHQYKNDFIYTDAKQWFYFSGHKWNMTTEGIELRKRICDLISPIQEEVDKIRAKIRQIDEDIRDKEEQPQNYDEGGGGDVSEKQKTTFDKKRLALIREKNQLEETGKKDKIIKECRELFFDKDFENKVDTNVYLLGFTNGVLDLQNKVFRDGRPDDFITLSTTYEFREYEDNAVEMKNVDDYLLRVFPDPEIRNYFLDQCCMYLRGGNLQKKVTIWSGAGDNSKSVTIDLIQNILGQYAIEFPTSMLTEKRSQSSAAAPELVRSRGRRFAVIQEPNETDTINIGLLKELSGNDRITTRALYKDQVEFKPQFKLSIICNKLPRIPCDDSATWNRLRVIPFESKFVDIKDCPATFEEQFVVKQFPKDPIFSEKLPKMKQAFMYKLFLRYKHAERFGMQAGEPEKVMMATRKYRSANDVFMNFLCDQLVEDPESLGIMLADLYDQFKNWFKNSYSGKYVAPKHELKEYLSVKYKKHFVINRLVGFRYRTEQDDEEKSE